MQLHGEIIKAAEKRTAEWQAVNERTLISNFDSKVYNSYNTVFSLPALTTYVLQPCEHRFLRWSCL